MGIIRVGQRAIDGISFVDYRGRARFRGKYFYVKDQFSLKKEKKTQRDIIRQLNI